jgi:RecA-family ATPase
LIVVDALYRFIPAGISENDNAAMMSLYNLLDLIASHTNAAIAVIHHTSKGDQSGKAVTDVGSGAGSIARAADTHLTIRPHEEDGMAVLQAVTRSFSPPEDRSIRWEYPHWTKAPWEPRLASRKTAGEEKQRRQDKETDDAIREALTERKQSVSELRGLTDYGQDRVVRSLKRLGATSKRLKSKRTGKITERFTLPVTT